jgi:hypothetical protein
MGIAGGRDFRLRERNRCNGGVTVGVTPETGWQQRDFWDLLRCNVYF